MRSFRKSYSLDSNSEHVNKGQEPLPVIPSLVHVSPHNNRGALDHSKAFVRVKTSTQREAVENSATDGCRTKSDLNENFCSVHGHEAGLDCAFQTRETTKINVKSVTPTSNNIQRALAPAKIADGLKVSSDPRSGQRLSRLWTGHRPLSTSVNCFVGQMEDSTQGASHQCYNGYRPSPRHCSEPYPSADSLNVPLASSASNPDLCSQVSLCSLQIDSGLGSETTSVLSSLDQLVIVDSLSLDTDQAYNKESAEVATDFGVDAIHRSSEKDAFGADTCQPPSDDDSSGITSSKECRESESIAIPRGASLSIKKQLHSHTGKDSTNATDSRKHCKSQSTPSSLPGPFELQESGIEVKKKKSVSASPNLPKESICAKYSSCRWVLAYLCFLVRFMQTALRQSLGIAIIGMTMKLTERVVTPDAGWEAWEADMARNDTVLQTGNSGSSGNEPVFLNLVRNGSTLRWTDENGHNWTMVLTTVRLLNSYSYILVFCPEVLKCFTVTEGEFYCCFLLPIDTFCINLNTQRFLEILKTSAKVI